jgi:bifunctional UDP-N-acetylglucosamine pyrophosphorylase/glucosamine-1-phosphate N-acetyltransferase/UDP-N-acetylglucosamine pyrophosphorylase
MKSDLPKVLVPVCGRPMIEYVVEALERAGIDQQIIVIGHRAELVREQLEGREKLCFVHQREQLGTGHAVMMCRDDLANYNGAVLVVAGDSPLMQSDSIDALFKRFEQDRPACLLGTGRRDDPTGFGRILRDETGRLVGIVEEKDATDQQRELTEVNLSCYVFSCRDLFASLEYLNNENTQGEYYLTDCPGILLAEGKQVMALDVLKPCEALSINTVEDLARVEQEMREIQA